MKLFHRKIFITCIILFILLTTVFVIIAIIGYIKAGSIVEKFQTDFKNVSETTPQFKKIVSALKTYKICIFVSECDLNMSFYIPLFENHFNSKCMLFKAINPKI